MTYIDGYHGTNKYAAQSILKFRHFISSLGDHHWLGDGIYFYYESIYAYKWNVNSWNKDYASKEISVKKITEKYSIICAKIEIENGRLFDLNTYEHSAVYDYTLENIKKYLADDFFSISTDITEGVVINVLFDKIGISKQFDAACKVYFLRKSKYYGLDNYKPHQSGFPERQICIKNQDCIKALSMYDNSEELEKLHKAYKDINKKLMYA